jgi:hypothetical protein
MRVKSGVIIVVSKTHITMTIININIKLFDQCVHFLSIIQLVILGSSWSIDMYFIIYFARIYFKGVE